MPIDWNNDEAVCKEAEPELYRMVSASTSFWKAARRRNSVRIFESKNRPPAVDVEKALYEALKDLRAVLWSEGYSDTHVGMSQADAAIALYEEKGKL